MSATTAPAGRNIRAVFVYEWPVRLVHWLSAICIVILAVTGFYIGRPFMPTMPGEAVDQFFMGYMRFAHFSAGYVLAVLFIGRFYWAIMGNRHASEMFFPPVFKAGTWSDAAFRMRYYFFLERDVPTNEGPNGLEIVAAFLMYTLPIIFLILTGFALYAEGAQAGSWQAAMFGWVRGMFGDSQALHTWHRMAMWVIVVFVIIHIYLVIRQDVMSRQSYISTMISGFRMYKD